MKRGYRSISDLRVKERTGKNSSQWMRILDKWGMKKKGHTLTAKYLIKKHKLSPWWAQVVTVKYEYAKGLRR